MADALEVPEATAKVKRWDGAGGLRIRRGRQRIRRGVGVRMAGRGACGGGARRRRGAAAAAVPVGARGRRALPAAAAAAGAVRGGGRGPPRQGGRAASGVRGPRPPRAEAEAHICVDCGYVHKGDWSALPADWKCPRCGSPKRRFDGYDLATGKSTGGAEVGGDLAIIAVAALASLGALFYLTVGQQ